MSQLIKDLQSDKAFLFYRGSVALYALLKAIGLEKDDEVILQVYTCDVVPAAIVRAGGLPVYVDINPQTFNLDPAKIEEKVSGKTKAIIVQHTYGIPTEMDRVLEIAKRYNLKVIEDSCHAFGSKYCGQEVGTFGDAAFYSFGWHKPVVLGVGGAAIVNNPTLRESVAEVYENFTIPEKKELLPLYTQYFAYSFLMRPSLFWFMRNTYRKLNRTGLLAGASKRKKKGSANAKKKVSSPNQKPSGKRIIPFQEKRLIKKLETFDKNMDRQKWVVSSYEEHLAETIYETLDLDDRFEPIFYKYPLLSHRKKDIFEQAPQARVELSNIFVSPLYPHLPQRAAYWRSLGYRKGMCPISEEVADTIVALPVHSKVQTKDIEKTVSFLKMFQG